MLHKDVVINLLIRISSGKAFIISILVGDLLVAFILLLLSTPSLTSFVFFICAQSLFCGVYVGLKCLDLTTDCSYKSLTVDLINCYKWEALRFSIIDSPYINRKNRATTNYVWFEAFTCPSKTPRSMICFQPISINTRCSFH